MARCDCGNEKPFLITNLRSGNSKSCGCNKNSGMMAFNARRATPQTWVIEGDIAHIFIRKVKVLVDTADLPLVSKYRWGMHHAYVSAKGCRLPMHRLIMGLANGDPREVDHKHHNPADNRRSELRIANSSQNKMNRKANVFGTSKYKGVHFDSYRDRFVAQIKAEGRHRLLGRYKTETDAARAYNEAALKYFGQFAYLNPL